MRYLLTNTTYGTWLPGDPRGSVTAVRDRRPGDPVTRARLRHNKPGQACEPEIIGLRRSAVAQLKTEPVWLTQEKARAVLRQFRETAAYRHWELLALAIMSNHFHMVLSAAAGENPRQILSSLKAYASRRLNQDFGRLEGKRWTKYGSCRSLKHPAAVDGAVNYVLYKQPNPLVVWSATLGQIV